MPMIKEDNALILFKLNNKQKKDRQFKKGQIKKENPCKI